MSGTAVISAVIIYQLRVDLLSISYLFSTVLNIEDWDRLSDKSKLWNF